MGQTQQRIDIIVRVIDKASAGLRKTDNIFKQMSKTGEIARGNFMGVGFAMLFMGMAMKKAAQNALRGIMTVYKEAVGENDRFVHATNQLNAAWTFFKYSLLEALAGSEAMYGMIEWVIQLVDWFSSLSDTGRTAIISFLLVAFAIGSIVSPLGQVALLSVSLGIGFIWIFAAAGLLFGVLTAIFIVLFSDMPTWEKWLAVIFIAILFIVGATILWTIAMVDTKIGILNSLKIMAIGFWATLKGIWTQILAVNLSLWQITVILALIGIGIYLLYQVWTSNMKPITKVILTFIIVLVIATGVMVAFGVASWAALWPVYLVLMIVVGAVMLLIWGLKKLGLIKGDMGIDAFKDSLGIPGMDGNIGATPTMPGMEEGSVFPGLETMPEFDPINFQGLPSEGTPGPLFSSASMQEQMNTQIGEINIDIQTGESDPQVLADLVSEEIINNFERYANPGGA